MLAELKSRYPQLYSDCRGIFCGEGWRMLIENASAELDALAQLEGVIVSIEDIRKKYGVLNIWATTSSAPSGLAADEIANRFETESERVCEFCGAGGKLREKRRWLSVRCNKCEVK